VSAPSASGGALTSSRLEEFRNRVWQRLAAVDTRTAEVGLVAVGFAIAAFLRLWQLNKFGFNSDEAVYSGQAAAIANDAVLKPFFPVFRAHPLLFQTILSLGYRLGTGDLFARLLADLFGVGSIVLTFLTGRLLYGRRAGVIAALLLAVMPYEVVVSRQVLLDGPMAFFATATLYLLARAILSRRLVFLYAAGGTMGLTALTKETGILILGGGLAFFLLSPEIRIRAKHAAGATAIALGLFLAYPLTLRLAAHTHAGQKYLVYQLFRRPNHGWGFYPTTVPQAIGLLVIVTALAGLWLLRREISWRETLLLSWIAAPALFFQLYPVKGYQYLIACAPPVALLAGRTLARWQPARDLQWRNLTVTPRWLMTGVTAVVAISLVVPAWGAITPSRSSGTFQAGSGGVPGSRELGDWIREHAPVGSEFLAIGPSMMNLVEFYGHRRAWALSVSPNPIHRNPAYDALLNPDRAIRTNEIQYLVWDAFSASRTKFFSHRLRAYARKYNGRDLYTYSVTVRGRDGQPTQVQLIVVYGVHR
jgi:Dolichyl-phosphate-mannose-protein mannosyltransferase